MPPRDLRNHRTRLDCLGNDPPLLPIAPPPAADHARYFRAAPNNIRVITNVDHNVHTIPRDSRSCTNSHSLSYVGQKHRLLPVIVLLCLNVRTHIFRRDETHGVPLRRQLATQVMRTATRFHRYHRRGPASPNQNLPRGSQADHAANVLAKINSQYHDVHRFAPLALEVSDHTMTAERGAGHSIITTDSSNSICF